MTVPAAALQHKYIYLDMARGLAALTVAIGHLRNFVLVDYASAGPLNPAWRGFYFITSLGHDAVMVFFVLSGFLIGQNVYDLDRAGRWSWRSYAIKRISRLWIVLIPALILTALWDTLGMRLFHGGLYTGALNGLYLSTPSPLDALRAYTLSTFFGNALFLQGIRVTTFGTNSALWSLSNEFWYYVLFPLGFFALRPGRPVLARLALGLAAAALCLWLPRDLVLYGLTWLLGFGVALAPRRRDRKSASPTRLPPLKTAMAAVFFVAALAAARIMGPKAADFLVAFAFAILLYFIALPGPQRGPLARIAGTLSEFSYTLYLAHVPLLAFLACALLNEHRVQPGGAGAAIFAGLTLAVLVYSYAIYLVFERQTKAVQSFLLPRLAGLGRGGRDA